MLGVLVGRSIAMSSADVTLAAVYIVAVGVILYDAILLGRLSGVL